MYEDQTSKKQLYCIQLEILGKKLYHMVYYNYELWLGAKHTQASVWAHKIMSNRNEKEWCTLINYKNNLKEELRAEQNKTKYIKPQQSISDE